MQKTILFLIILLVILSTNKAFGQTELGLSREKILALPFVMEYSKKHNNLTTLDFEIMEVTSEIYHYTFRFSNIGVCNALTLTSRSYLGDIKLRDYLNMYGVPISISTYILNSPDKNNRQYAFIVATHNGLPHQVVFSYKQMFKTEAIPRIDEYPYELIN